MNYSIRVDYQSQDGKISGQIGKSNLNFTQATLQLMININRLQRQNKFPTFFEIQPMRKDKSGRI